METLSATTENQPPPLTGHDLFSGNLPLVEELRRAAPWAARCGR